MYSPTVGLLANTTNNLRISSESYIKELELKENNLNNTMKNFLEIASIVKRNSQ